VSLELGLGIGLLGGLGAVARLHLDGAAAARAGREFPYGTLLVNLLGSFVLGILVGATVSPDAYRLLGTGLIGAFTTFSTWALEGHRLGEDGAGRLAILNFALSVVPGIAVAWAGRRVGGWL
jgi:fluoride exporter